MGLIVSAGNVSETTHILYPNPAEGEVRVTVRVWETDAGNRGATVEIRCMPGYAWWSCPDSRTLRRLVDREVAGTGWRREGERRRGDYVTWGWRFYYGLA